MGQPAAVLQLLLLLAALAPSSASAWLPTDLEDMELPPHHPWVRSMQSTLELLDPGCASAQAQPCIISGMHHLCRAARVHGGLHSPHACTLRRSWMLTSSSGQPVARGGSWGSSSSSQPTISTCLPARFLKSKVRGSGRALAGHPCGSRRKGLQRIGDDGGKRRCCPFSRHPPFRPTVL